MNLPPISDKLYSKLEKEGMTNHQCSDPHCNSIVDPRRYKAANNYKSKDMKRFVNVLCEHCINKGKDVEEVGGVTLIRGKTDYHSVQLVPKSTAIKVQKISDRAATGVSKAMKHLRN